MTNSPSSPTAASPRDIVYVAIANRLTTLVTAITAAGLEDDLLGPNRPYKGKIAMIPPQNENKVKGRALSLKSTKAPTVRSTKAPTVNSTKAPTVKSTKAPVCLAAARVTSKSTKAPIVKSTKTSTGKSTKAATANSQINEGAGLPARYTSNSSSSHDQQAIHYYGHALLYYVCS